MWVYALLHVWIRVQFVGRYASKSMDRGGWLSAKRVGLVGAIGERWSIKVTFEATAVQV